MAELRTVVISIHADRADELVAALSLRDYISIVELTRDERKNRHQCPACGQKLVRERTHTVDENLAEALLRMVKMMETAKSVILTNDRNPKEKQPPAEQLRCVEMRPTHIEKAERLGLIQSFEDGSRKTHFMTERGLGFISGKEELDPASVVVLNGKVIATSGILKAEEIRFKDRIRRDIFLKEARRAVRDLPSSVVDFVQRGQMSLI